jgi:Protein of unknown function (DUF2568)
MLFSMIKQANLLLKFLLELAAFAAFAIWGAEAESDTALAIAHAILAPLIVALLWGRFAAPRSRHRLPTATRIPFELTVFALAAVALISVGHTVAAIVFAVVVAINALLMTAWDQWEG